MGFAVTFMGRHVTFVGDKCDASGMKVRHLWDTIWTIKIMN